MASTNELKFKILTEILGAKGVDELRGKFDQLGNSSKKLQSGFGSLGGALKALAGAFAIKSAVDFGKSLIDTGDELLALSERTGIAVKDLSGFKAAAEQADLPFDGLVSSLKKFSVNLADAKSGTSDTAIALKNIGVSALESNGQLRNSGDVIKDIADRFKNLKDGPEKAKIAFELFGKAGVDLVPFLNQGADALTKFGLAIDDDFAARADQFNDSLAVLGTQLKNIAISGLSDILPTLQEVLNAFTEAPKGIESSIGAFDVLGETLRVLSVGFVVFKDAFINGLDAIVTIGRNQFEYLASIVSGITDQVLTRAQQLKSLATLDLQEADRLGAQLAERGLERDAEYTKKRDAILEGFAERSRKRAEDSLQFAEKLQKNSLLFGDGSTDEIKARQKADTAPSPRRQSGEVADVSGLGSKGRGGPSKLQQEIEAARAYRQAGLESLEVDRLKLEAYKYSDEELKKLTETKRIDIEVTRATKNFTAEGKQAYLEAAEAIKTQRLALIELEEQQKASFSVGAQQGLKEYLEGVRDVASQSKQLFANAFKGMEDALVTFVKGGKLSFRDLADSIISDLIRISIRQGITGPLASGLASIFSGIGGVAGGPAAGGASIGSVPMAANGGIMTPRGMAKLSMYARGGVATSPQLAVFGEGSTPEAYVPLPDGRSIPVTMQGGGSGGVMVNVTVNVEKGTESTSTAGEDRETGKKLGSLITAAVRNELLNQKRPGGLLYS